MELVQRSEEGAYMKEKEFNLTLAKRIMNLVQDYVLVYDPGVLVPSDDELVDKIYQASVELLAEIEVYNQ